MLTTQFQPQPQPQQQTVTVEKYNHVKNTLKDMWKQVKTLEASSINETQTKRKKLIAKSLNCVIKCKSTIQQHYV